MMPLQPKKDFSLPEDKDDLEYGRVLLFFSVLIPGHLGKRFETDLAFIQYFDHYKVKGKKVEPVVTCVLEHVPIHASKC
jgi:hypothetical protein